MAEPDLRLVRIIARRLSAALEIREEAAADVRIDAIMQRTLRSDRHLESTFAAVQMLRDLGTIDQDEAAYLFHSIIDARQWDDASELDSGTAKLIENDPEQVELIIASMGHHDLLEMETFYRSRGEFALADLVHGDVDTYDEMVARGQGSIFDEKNHGGGLPEDERSTDSCEVMERVLALSSHESIKEWLQSWKALVESLERVTPATAVRAVQEARDIGALTFEGSLRLMDQVIHDPVWEECYADRHFRQLERKLESMDEAPGRGDHAGAKEPTFEYRMTEAEVARRYNGLKAVVLRRFGEHRMANLLIDDPAEYDRIVNGG
jgi:hypothetical protein